MEAEVKKEIRVTQKGPMEGMIIVNGRPRMEEADMPVLHIRSVDDVKRLTALMDQVNKQLQEQ